MALETPIAFFVFNRPESTARVLAAIAEVRPTRLLIVGDGARPDRAGEAERVALTRECAQHVTWPCEVRTDFAPVNLGCRRRVASGLDWVFNTVDEAIILEDDCLPDPTFFGYCQQLLRRYRDDPRVAAISGDNFQGGISRTPYSYYFSKYFHCWGWASWRRVWQHFDVDMRSWPAFRASGQLRNWADSSVEAWYWTQIFERAYRGQIDTWDYPWLYACWRQAGLTILPDVNLVSNIGFAAEGTHTHDVAHPSANLPTRPLPEVHHPPTVVRHRLADQFTFSHHHHRETRRKRLRREFRELVGRVKDWFGGSGERASESIAPIAPDKKCA